jgi:hypothetical protein
MCGKLDVKLEILYGKMALKVVNVLEHFLAFAMTFNVVVKILKLPITPLDEDPPIVL